MIFLNVLLQARGRLSLESLEAQDPEQERSAAWSLRKWWRYKGELIGLHISSLIIWNRVIVLVTLQLVLSVIDMIDRIRGSSPSSCGSSPLNISNSTPPPDTSSPGGRKVTFVLHLQGHYDPMILTIQKTWTESYIPSYKWNVDYREECHRNWQILNE